MVNICISCGSYWLPPSLLPSLPVLYSTMNDWHTVVELKRGALFRYWDVALSQFVESPLGPSRQRISGGRCSFSFTIVIVMLSVQFEWKEN
jgi:hypothetical protein